MKNDKGNALLTRDGILTLLSDAEIAKVSTAETAAGLAIGEDYVDLLHIDKGVQKATTSPLALKNVIPRKAVHEDTWTKIVAALAHARAAVAPPLS